MKLTPIAAQIGRCALLATLAGIPLSAVADYGNDPSRPGFNIGAGAGLNSLNSEDYTPDNRNIEDEQVSFRGFAGFRLNPIVSLEATYVDFGTSEDGGNHVDVHGVSAGGVFEAPMTRVVHPYAKAGVLVWDADSSFSDVQRNDKGTDFTYGAGLRFVLGSNVDLRAEYDRYEMDRNDVHTISSTVQFNF